MSAKPARATTTGVPPADFDTTVDAPLCSKCSGALDRDATQQPRWCKACRNAYQRDYRNTELQMAANRGFLKGVETMRLMLAAEFARLGKAAFSGREVAFAITNAPAPSWPDVPKPAAPVSESQLDTGDDSSVSV